jgi:hypothetical protein
VRLRPLRAGDGRRRQHGAEQQAARKRGWTCSGHPISPRAVDARRVGARPQRGKGSSVAEGPHPPGTLLSSHRGERVESEGGFRTSALPPSPKPSPVPRERASSPPRRARAARRAGARRRRAAARAVRHRPAERLDPHAVVLPSTGLAETRAKCSAPRARSRPATRGRRSRCGRPPSASGGRGGR